MNGEQIFDQAIAIAGRLSAIAQLNDMLREARAADRRLCGNCYFWMKSSLCPRETRNRQGRREGPHCNSLACEKFELENWVAELKQDRMKAAADFALKHGLAKEAAQ